MPGLFALESGTIADAQRILHTKDTLRGIDYLNSPLKHRFERVVTTALSTGAIVPIACLATTV